MMQISFVDRDELTLISKINEEAIPAVNTVSKKEFIWFYENSIYFKKVTVEKILAGFLLVLPMNIPYKSLNYSWFSKRFNNFAYIDRIAVKEEYKSLGIGTLLYSDLEQSLPKDIKIIACEYNIKPLNKVSQNFHQKMEYKNVGTQFTENNTKEVSLMIKKIND
tara:strand:+ start:966 stop:1457 length:492 start_codon:yes stop_codon:yes gene_type:complete